MGLMRDLNAAFQAALAKPFYPVMLVHIDWPDDPVRVHSGVGVLSWDGYAWVGVGEAGFLQLPAEAPGLADFEGEASVGGLDEHLDGVLDADPRWRAVDVHFGAVTTRAGAVLIGQPEQVFWGYVDSMRDRTEWTEEGALRAVVLGLGVGPAQRAADAIHHSYEAQIARRPGDTSGRWLKGNRTRVASIAVPK